MFRAWVVLSSVNVYALTIFGRLHPLQIYAMARHAAAMGTAATVSATATVAGQGPAALHQQVMHGLTVKTSDHLSENTANLAVQR
jgi:hypothetical protein